MDIKFPSDLGVLNLLPLYAAKNDLESLKARNAALPLDACATSNQGSGLTTHRRRYRERI